MDNKLVLSYYQRFIGRNLTKEEKNTTKFQTIESLPVRHSTNLRIIEIMCDYIDIYAGKNQNLFVTEPNKEAVIALYHYIEESGEKINNIFFFAKH